MEKTMVSRSMPLVSIVTPVYNNEKYIAECIESVLAQTYQNWEYTIVNNCSTDKSGEVAHRYAAKYSRIKVHDNQQFLPVVSNHNFALRQISSLSKYCKIVFSDDWIFPRCIEEMVAIAEEYPSVGIVQAYGLWEVIDREPHEHVIMWSGLPYPSKLVAGRDVCRRTFLDGLDIFGTPTSLLYRSDLVRSRNSFYNEANLHADKEACLLLLKTSDFGFAHQVLTFTRGRPRSLNKMSVDMYLDIGCALHNLIAHGPAFLTRYEFEDCLERHLTKYYNFLAVSLMRGRREKEFWDFHRKKLNETIGFSRTRLAGAALTRLCKAILHPYETVEKLYAAIKRSVKKQTSEKIDTRELAVHANELQ
jgi:glycosyltransferase involved in cell wall biosynthesis